MKKKMSGTTKIKLTKSICFILIFFSPSIYAGQLTDSATLRVVVRIPPKMTANLEPVSSITNQKSYSLCVNSSGDGMYRIHRPLDNGTSNLMVNYGQISGNYSNELVAGEYSHPIKSYTNLSGRCDNTERVQINIRPSAEETTSGALRLIVAAE